MKSTLREAKQEDSDTGVEGLTTRASSVCGDTSSDSTVIERGQPEVGTTLTPVAGSTALSDSVAFGTAL